MKFEETNHDHSLFHNTSDFVEGSSEVGTGHGVRVEIHRSRQNDGELLKKRFLILTIFVLKLELWLLVHRALKV